jgi:hypothetical protein
MGRTTASCGVSADGVVGVSGVSTASVWFIGIYLFEFGPFGSKPPIPTPQNFFEFRYEKKRVPSNRGGLALIRTFEYGLFWLRAKKVGKPCILKPQAA